MIEGGCSCGAIRYRIDGSLQHARACHCSRCRKIFSGASSAYAEVAPGSNFTWLTGADRLTKHGTGDGWGLAFCSVCGSTLCGMAGESVHGVTLGSVDGDPGVQLEMHIFVGSKAPWDHIGGDAPRFDEGPPSDPTSSSAA
ncbi:GFA family protein [Chondromyces crocatus]|uniref:GFA family protein n=1 Tax=Chondromyces crocatus TaxID=52 RepID=UPI0009EAA47E|nr:GFA family protein [Chondromyces crocatus]